MSDEMLNTESIVNEERTTAKARRKGRGADEKGFTLLEILIAMTILAFGLLGIGGLAATATMTAASSQSLTQASNIAQDRVEALLTVDFNQVYLTDVTASDLGLDRNCSTLVASVSEPIYECIPVTTVIPVDGVFYSWSYTITGMDLDANGTYSFTRDGLMRVDVTVTWNDQLLHRSRSVTLMALRSRNA